MLGLLLACAIACDREPESERSASPSTPASSVSGATEPEPFDAPRLLFLPDAGDVAPPESPFAPLGPRLPATGSRCPVDMVEVARSFCIDRYEMSLSDTQKGRNLSPFYHPEPEQLRATHRRWLTRANRSQTQLGRELAVPTPPAWQLSEPFDVRAMSQRGVLPSGYLNAIVAARACRNAGKRLCSREEWVTACRGEQNRKFPYGDQYRAGVCNVHREAHPASLLHANASLHHLDPRLNLTHAAGKPLLRRSGETPACASRWGHDAVQDMVGNLDEWVSDESGVFVGGFFSRATTEGCDAAISSHPPEYYDYSLGARCCRNL